MVSVLQWEYSYDENTIITSRKISYVFPVTYKYFVWEFYFILFSICAQKQEHSSPLRNGRTTGGYIRTAASNHHVNWYTVRNLPLQRKKINIYRIASMSIYSQCCDSTLLTNRKKNVAIYNEMFCVEWFLSYITSLQRILLGHLDWPKLKQPNY